MKLRLFLSVTLALMGCENESVVQPFCGQPSAIWTPAENIDRRHLALEHLIEVTHAGQVLVNQELADKRRLMSFLAAEDKRSPSPIIYFDFDAHANCKVVRETRAAIEQSGVCKTSNCITGDDSEEPPPADEQDGLFDK